MPANVGRSDSSCHAVWDRINLPEIDARIGVLAGNLRQDRTRFFQQRVRHLHSNVPPAFRSHPGIAEQPDLVLRAALDTDLDFLRRFLRGVREVFAQYLKGTQLGLEPQDVAELWAGGIEPRWKREVQSVAARWRRRVDLDQAVREAYISDAEAAAGRIYDEELGCWRIKIAGAKQETLSMTGASEMAVAASGKPAKPALVFGKYRSEIKRQIVIQLARNPKATDLDICRGLDADGGVEIPPRWRGEPGDRLFADAYMNPSGRTKIQVMISKIRKDLRNGQLL